MALYGKEKIWFLVNRLSDEREVTSAGQPVALHPANDLNKHYLPLDLISLASKLEKEHNAVKLLNNAPTDQTYGKYLFELLPDFDKYVAELEDDPEYLEWSGKKPKPKKPYFDPSRQVDFSKSSEQNKDNYISVGQIEELEKMPKDERTRIMKESLTDKNRKDIDEFSKTSLQLIKGIQDNFKLNIPKISPVLSDVSFALPPNYEAEQVRLLRQLVNQQEASKPSSESNNQTYSITYTKSRQVLLNGVFQLAQPTFNGENDLVFSYLCQHPNKPLSKKQLESELKITISKPLHKIVENLGFKGDLAKAFFSVSKGSIVFRNPVSTDELNQMGLSIIRLNKSNNS